MCFFGISAHHKLCPVLSPSMNKAFSTLSSRFNGIQFHHLHATESYCSVLFQPDLTKNWTFIEYLKLFIGIDTAEPSRRSTHTSVLHWKRMAMLIKRKAEFPVRIGSSVGFRTGFLLQRRAVRSTPGGVGSVAGRQVETWSSWLMSRVTAAVLQKKNENNAKDKEKKTNALKRKRSGRRGGKKRKEMTEKWEAARHTQRAADRCPPTVANFLSRDRLRFIRLTGRLPGFYRVFPDFFFPLLYRVLLARILLAASLFTFLPEMCDFESPFARRVFPFDSKNFIT